MELYDSSSPADSARFAAELILSAACGLLAAAQLWEIFAALRRPRGLRKCVSRAGAWAACVLQRLLQLFYKSPVFSANALCS